MVRVNFMRSVCVALVAFGLLFTAANGSTEPLPEATPGTSLLTIKVVGARNAKGKIGVALFQSPEGFPENGSAALRREQTGIDSQTMGAEVVFRDLPPGVYAVAVFHDENMNGKLDKNFLGIPQEGYGASNNPGKKMRAPRFDEARFSLSAPQQTIEIKLIY
jgi:uncharacterized protein (DUF2141 family)